MSSFVLTSVLFADKNYDETLGLPFLFVCLELSILAICNSEERSPSKPKKDVALIQLLTLLFGETYRGSIADSFNDLVHQEANYSTNQWKKVGL